MGYKVIYFEEKSPKRPIRIVLLTLMMFSLFLGWTFRHWEQGRALLFDMMLHIPEAKLDEAVQAMSEQLIDGRGLGETLHAFFQTVFPGSLEDLY